MLSYGSYVAVMIVGWWICDKVYSVHLRFYKAKPTSFPEMEVIKVIK